jgi:hypothetical protein
MLPKNELTGYVKVNTDLVDESPTHRYIDLFAYLIPHKMIANIIRN